MGTLIDCVKIIDFAYNLASNIDNEEGFLHRIKAAFENMSMTRKLPSISQQNGR